MPSATDQAVALSAEEDGFLDDAQAINSTSMNYVGGNTRIGVGFDTEFKGRIDGSHVFMESQDSVTSGQGWLGLNPMADEDKHEEIITGAGAKVNHHWVTRDEAGRPVHVNKVFGAYDQNEAQDKKVTAGYGQEQENMFWSGHVSKGLSDRRHAGYSEKNEHVYEKAYDYGVGGRVGAFMGDHLMRIQGGLDYEWGTEQASSEDTPSQLSVSGGVEKFFPDSPHSIGANIEVSKKNGGYAGDKHEADISGNVSYRYDFGGAGLFASDEQYRRVRVEIPGKTEVVKVKKKRPPKVERKLVKHTMELEADTFFKKGDHHLTGEAQQRLRTMIARIRQTGHHGRIRVVGNTCDLGSHQANQTLSEQRAAQVRNFMASNGFNPNELMAVGLGETQPKYPNTDATRHKNRRVDIEYVAYQNNYKDEVIEQGYDIEEKVRVISEPRVVWRKELIDSPPTWVGQALRNNIQYKQSIDTYRTLGADAVTSDGNSAPVVVDDHAETAINEAIMIDVLSNDSDPDGDRLSVSNHDSTSSQGGTVTVQAETQKLVYTPAADFTGTDTFTYTATDGNGNVRTATVTVVVGGSASTLVAANDQATTEVNTQVMIDVLANDTDTDGDIVTILGYADNSENGGSITEQDGKLIFTPAQDFTGEDSFVYTITDGNGNQANATVTITVERAGGAGLVAVDDSENTKIDTPVSLNVLANDSDSDGDTITIESFDETSTDGGSIVSEDGLLVYTPASGYTGTDTFNYTITDNNGETATATVTINVLDNGDATFVPADDSYTVAPDDLDDKAQVNLDVLSNDTFEGSVSIRIMSHPALGSIQNVDGSGNIDTGHVVYQPNNEAVGVDTFTYVLVDADGNVSNPATVTINLPGVTDGGGDSSMKLTDDGTQGEIPGDAYSFYSNDTVTRNLSVLDNDSGDGLEIIAITVAPRFGSASVSSDGKSVNYTLRSGYCEDHYFVYRVRDQHGNEAEARVNINVLDDNKSD
ncbi:MAG: Ig-like domain-containing protein [Thiolinea sp.]